MKDKLCELCRIETFKYKRNRRFCGSQRQKTGCAYKWKLMTNKKYWLRFLKAHPNYIKEVEKKRYETGYYEQPHIVESLRKTRRKQYLKEKEKKLSVQSPQR